MKVNKKICQCVPTTAVRDRANETATESSWVLATIKGERRGNRALDRFER